MYLQLHYVTRSARYLFCLVLYIVVHVIYVHSGFSSLRFLSLRLDIHSDFFVSITFFIHYIDTCFAVPASHLPPDDRTDVSTILLETVTHTVRTTSASCFHGYGTVRCPRGRKWKTISRRALSHCPCREMKRRHAKSHSERDGNPPAVRCPGGS